MATFETEAERRAYAAGFSDGHDKGQGNWTDKNGEKMHSCGRPYYTCKQKNGQFWCEIIREPYYGGYDG